MAINFLQTVDLNQNSLDNARIQNLVNDPATGVVGQIIFNTTADTLKQYVAEQMSLKPLNLHPPLWQKKLIC